MWVRNNPQQSLSQKGEAKTLAFFISRERPDLILSLNDGRY
jgi:hypothetical protein